MERTKQVQQKHTSPNAVHIIVCAKESLGRTLPECWHERPKKGQKVSARVKAQLTPRRLGDKPGLT